MWCLALMSVCMLLPFLFNVVGDRVTEEAMDVMKLSVFTLGNMGGCAPVVRASRSLLLGRPTRGALC